LGAHLLLQHPPQRPLQAVAASWLFAAGNSRRRADAQRRTATLATAAERVRRGRITTGRAAVDACPRGRSCQLRPSASAATASRHLLPRRGPIAYGRLGVRTHQFPPWPLMPVFRPPNASKPLTKLNVNTSVSVENTGFTAMRT